MAEFVADLGAGGDVTMLALAAGGDDGVQLALNVGDLDQRGGA